MPDYRLIHRRALRGEKVAKLTDFERGVWLAYLLVSDDYGVMPFDAGELGKAIWLKGKPYKTVQKALEAFATSALFRLGPTRARLLLRPRLAGVAERAASARHHRAVSAAGRA
jgi:hypothetical protein